MHRSSKEALTYFLSAWVWGCLPAALALGGTRNWVLQQCSVGGLLAGARCQVDNTEASYLRLMSKSNVTRVFAGSKRSLLSFLFQCMTPRDRRP